MALKTILNYSPNFNHKKRTSKQIVFIIFHYTGMKKESDAIEKLTNIQSEVSSHYLIKNDGNILTLVPDLYEAWHAGKSSWKKYKSLNKNSIGIEISNPGHDFGYRDFSDKQIISILRLGKFLIKKYSVQSRNILGHSDIAVDRKKDPGEKFPWKYLAHNKIGIWHKLSNKILKQSRMQKIDKKSKEFFLKNLSKIGYSKSNTKNLDKKKNLIFVIKAFQRRFRQDLVNGKIDKECLLISKNLLKKFN